MAHPQTCQCKMCWECPICGTRLKTRDPENATYVVEGIVVCSTKCQELADNFINTMTKVAA